MAKTSALPTPDPIPAEGGSYLLDEKTGKWQLLDRTEPAKLDAAQPQLDAKSEAKPEAKSEAEPEADTAPAQLDSSTAEG
jgi:hypothetical protein